MVFLKKICFTFLQGCYCERLITPGNQHSNGLKSGKEDEKMVNFIKIIMDTSHMVTAKKVLLFGTKKVLWTFFWFQYFIQKKVPGKKVL